VNSQLRARMAAWLIIVVKPNTAAGSTITFPEEVGESGAL
jgi:hypothetical protein